MSKSDQGKKFPLATFVGITLLVAAITLLVLRSSSDTSELSDNGIHDSRSTPNDLPATPTTQTKRTSERPEKRLPKTLEERVAELINKTPRSYLSSSGRIASGFKDDFNLTDDEFEQLQKSIDVYWGEMTKLTASRLALDEEASETSPDHAIVYRLPAMLAGDRRNAIVDLKKSLDNVTGDAVAMEIIASLESVGSHGYLGKYDMEFRFTPSVVRILNPDGSFSGKTIVESDEMMARFTVRDPNNGRILGSGAKPANYLNDEYGNVFDFGP